MGFESPGNSGSISYIMPQGGDDGPGIRSALAANDVVELRKATFNVGATVGAAGAGIELADGKTLVLNNATLKRADNALGPIIMNASPTGGNTDIAIIGEGNAIIDGNGANNPNFATTTTSWKSDDILLVSVTRAKVANLYHKNPGFDSLFLQTSPDFLIRNYKVSAPNIAGHQPAGIVVYACLKGEINGYYGTTYDDGICLTTHQTLNAGLPMTGIYPIGGVAPGGTLGDIAVRDMRGAWGTGQGNVIRVFNGDGQAIDSLAFSQIVNEFNASPVAAMLSFDAGGYVNTLPSNGSCLRIKMEDFSGSCTDVVLATQTVYDLQVLGGRVRTNGSLLNMQSNSIAQTIQDAAFGHILIERNAGVNSLLTTQSGVTINRASLRNIAATQASWLLNNLGTVTNLTMRGIDIGTLTGGVTNSTVKETGDISDVRVGTLSGSSYLGKAFGMRINGAFPKLTTAVDTAPDPVYGSMVAGTLVLDGGAAGDALYYGDGTAWNRLKSLAN